MLYVCCIMEEIVACNFKLYTRVMSMFNSFVSSDFTWHYHQSLHSASLFTVQVNVLRYFIRAIIYCFFVVRDSFLNFVTLFKYLLLTLVYFWWSLILPWFLLFLYIWLSVDITITFPLFHLLLKFSIDFVSSSVYSFNLVQFIFFTQIRYVQHRWLCYENCE